jgi:Beta-propeller repeat/IPT/TIG domain
MKKATLISGAILTVLLGLETSGAKPPEAKTLQPLALPRAQAVPDFGRTPLNFIPNAGQVEGPAVFYVQGRDTTIYFAPEGLTFVLSGAPEPTPERWVVKLDFLDANPEAIPVSLEESGTVVSYFKGTPGGWKAGLKASSRIVYRELWPGIDLAYSGTGDRLKYEFLVHPGADPSRIRLAYRGATKVDLTADGRLAVSTSSGGFEDDVPAAWQEVEAARVNVPVAYSLDKRGDDGGSVSPAFVYTFDIGKYDDRLPLVIDPSVLVYCGFIGGAANEEGDGIAVGDLGNAYVTGYTRSDETAFPVVVGPDLTFNAGPGNGDIFVAKVNAEGTALVYCGYIGGVGFEGGWDIAVDDQGNAYITGEVGSTEGSFPVSGGPDLTFNGGIFDAFIVKVNADGKALGYCGYIGGAIDDYGYGVAVDGSGNAYITGQTYSGATFPAVVGPNLPGTGWNIFVAKVNPAGAFVYCGRIGGEGGADGGRAIAVDHGGNAYITGGTNSMRLPVKGGPDLTSNGGTDAFVAKLNAAGTELVYCGYIGGLSDDGGNGIAVDPSGNVYITGDTESAETTFPVKTGPDLTYNGSRPSAFVAKVDPSGTGLVYCGYLDGQSRGYRIRADDSGFAYLTGVAGANFPVVAGPDLTFNGGGDAFVTKVNRHGTALVYSGFVGGAAWDAGVAIALDGSGSAYITGATQSGEGVGFPVLGGPDLTYNGYEFDGFVAKISPYDVSDPNMMTLVPPDARAGDPAFTLHVTGSSFADGAVVMWGGSDRPTLYLSEQELDADVGAVDLMAVKPVLITVRNPDGGVSNALEFSVGNPVPGLASLSQTRATAGGPSLSLTLTGSNFVTGSVVNWAGNATTTTYISATELNASIPAHDLAVQGEFPVTVTNPAPGGGTSGAISVQVAGFIIEPSPPSVTVSAGQSAIYDLQVTPQYGSFDATATLRCTGLPRACTASFAPVNLTPGDSPVSSTLTLKTSAGGSAAAGGTLTASPPLPWDPGLLILPSVLGSWLCFKRLVPMRRNRRSLALAVIVLCIMGAIVSCSAGGGDDPFRTPPGTYQISILGQSGSFQATASVTLVVR